MKEWLKKRLKEHFEIEFFIYKLLLVVPSNKLLSYRYKKKFGTKPNLKKPKTYNEKILWLMLNWNDKQAKMCADKYLVRGYVKEKVGDDILNELYQVVDKSNQINFDALPNQFVIKSTQGCGMNYICTDKSQLIQREVLKKLSGYTTLNYFYNKTRELVYKDMKPKIIVERFLGVVGKVPKDYKIYCFNGKPFMIQVDIDRFEDTHRENFYDINWNLLDIEDLDCPSDPLRIEEQPKLLEKMLNYAKLLSADFPHVRVDFYVDGGKVIFGELTFSTAAGKTNWSPKEFDVVLGKQFELPLARKNDI